MPKRSYENYYKKYQQERRPMLCGQIRGTPEEVSVLQKAKRRSGLSWKQIIYRGLRLKRPEVRDR